MASVERFGCGVALALLVLFGLPTLLAGLGRLGGRLAAIPTRPPLFVSMVLIVSGTLCLLAALGVAAATATASGGASTPTMSVDGGNFQFGATAAVAPAGPSPILTLVALLVLLTGVGMAAVGVWCALPPTADAGSNLLAGPHAMPKPEPFAEM
jgi:hypothetical protein